MLNAFFVASEYALLTLRKSKIDYLIRKKTPGFKRVKKSVNNIFDILSATQLGTTVCSILIGWYGGTLVNIAFFSTSTIAILLTLGILTVIQVVMGELIPKSVAINKSTTISRIIIIPLNIFIFIFKPFIKLLQTIAEFILKILRLDRLNKHSQSDYTTGEIKIILEQSKKIGIIPLPQVDIISNTFQLNKITVKKLMIKIKKLTGFKQDHTIHHIYNKIIKKELTYNRFPIFSSNSKHIVGFIHISDIIRLKAKHNKNVRLYNTDSLRKVLYTSDAKKVDEMLIEMNKKRINIAVSQNKNKQDTGIITLSDIINYLIKTSSPKK